MTYARRSIGTFDDTIGGNLAPGLPAGMQPGDEFYYITGAFAASPTPGATPAGWSKQTLNTSVGQIVVYGMSAVGGGSDVVPVVSWGSGYAWAVCVAYSGGAGFSQGYTPFVEKSTSSANVINSPSVTRGPTGPGALCLIVAKRDKTSASNGAVYGLPPAIGGINWSAVLSNVPSGSNVCDSIVWELIQTTANNIPPNTGASSTGGGTDTSNNMQSTLLIFLPGTLQPPGMQLL